MICLWLSMSKLLIELLGVSDALFAIGLRQFENASGHASVDVRLTAEIIGKVHQKTRELGLDPNDSTPEEVYYALINLAKKHDTFLAKRLGVRDPTDVQAVLGRVKSFAEELDTPRSVWALKHSVARRLLKAAPPRKVMKQLGYRSVDSMIKREPVANIFMGMHLVESEAWLHKFVHKYRALKPADFETRDAALIQLDTNKWGRPAEAFVRQRHHNIHCLNELGVVAILPLPMRRMHGLAITTLPLLLHSINELRIFSTFIKLQQVKPNFGEVVADAVLGHPEKHIKVAGHDFHWRIVHRHFAKAGPAHHPEEFEPHLQPEDLLWRKAEETLYRLEPALHFWYDMDFVARRTLGRPVSFNLTDVATSYVNHARYGEQAVGYFRGSLWNEICLRYLSHPSLEFQALKQLDNRTLEPAMRTLFGGVNI